MSYLCKNCINNAISLVEFKVSILEKNLNLDDFDSKVKFLTGVSNILSKILNTFSHIFFMCSQFSFSNKLFFFIKKIIL